MLVQLLWERDDEGEEEVGVITARRAPVSAKRAVIGWHEAFNARDLEAMLELMDPDVDFQPLSLRGDCRTYRGHDGICEWFAVLMECKRKLRIERLTVSAHVTGELIASGMLTRLHCSQPTPFCGVHTVEDGLIVCAYHYLSDPDSVLELDAADAAPRRS